MEKLIPVASDDVAAPAFFDRRLMAAACDAAVVGVCCLGLAGSFNVVSHARHLWVWGPAAGLLAGYAAMECLTDATPGKRLFALAVRRVDGRTAPMAALIIRALVRLLPVGVFLAALCFTEPAAYFLLCFAAFVLVVCDVPACYITLVRTARTPFDLAAGTKVVSVRPGDAI